MLEERFKEPPTTMSPEASDASPTLQKNGSKGGSAVVIYRCAQYENYGFFSHRQNSPRPFSIMTWLYPPDQWRASGSLYAKLYKSQIITKIAKLSAPDVNVYRSVYREILFLTLTALGQNIIDLTALDRVVKEAFENLPDNFKEVAQKADFAPDRQVSFCRKIFRELTIWGAGWRHGNKYIWQVPTIHLISSNQYLLIRRLNELRRG